jgi:hypothetical protein
MGRAMPDRPLRVVPPPAAPAAQAPQAAPVVVPAELRAMGFWEDANAAHQPVQRATSQQPTASLSGQAAGGTVDPDVATPGPGGDYAQRMQTTRFADAAPVPHRFHVHYTIKKGTIFTHAIPPGWRLVTIEDMPELTGLPHANVVNLFYSKGGQSVANTRAEDLVEAALRMGMDGLLNQELRDEAAYAYLNVLASGHWGMTTTHADSAGQARDRIRGLIKKHPAGRHLADADVMTALHRSIDVVVHCARDGERRYIEQVLYDPEPKDRAGDAGGILAIAAE